MKTLVVDDEADIEPLFRQRYCRKIRQGEIPTVFAYSVKEALLYLSLRPYFPEVTLILSGINLLGKRGLELVRMIRTWYTLTAGIAHEDQTLLKFVHQFLVASTELVKELKQEIMAYQKDDVLVMADESIQKLGIIHHHGEKAGSILKRRLQYSSASCGNTKLANSNDLADECIKLCNYGMRAKDKNCNAALITDIDTKLGKIKTVAQETGRMPYNLFNNDFYTTDKKRKVVKKNYLVEAIKQKIFHPFFTIKPTGEDTGIAFSLSYDLIISLYGRDMSIATKKYENARFTELLLVKYILLFPAVNA